MERGRPLQVLRADVATAKATADSGKAEGHADLARARVRVPGLPMLSLIEVEQVTSKAVCEAGRKPVASSNLSGPVKVLGKKVTLSAGGPTRVEVPGVGEVTLDTSTARTTSRTAAATALRLKVSVNPLKLNVAEVTGEVTLVEATCESPAAPRTQEPSEQPSRDIQAQSGRRPEENLAATGGGATTVYLAGGSAILLALGGGAVVLARGRSRD